MFLIFTGNDTIHSKLSKGGLQKKVNKFKLEREQALLLIIDLQERLMNAMKDRERVYGNTRLLLATARELQIPVIVTEQYPRGLGPTVPEIKEALPAECHYVEKVSFSACCGDLDGYLPGAGRRQIIVTGSETHVCVFQTTRDLLEQGFLVTLASDAVCSRTDENYQNGLQLMRDMGAVISNTESIIFDLLIAAGSPEFKAISPLLK